MQINTEDEKDIEKPENENASMPLSRRTPHFVYEK